MQKESLELFVKVFLITVVVGSTIVFGMSVIDDESHSYDRSTSSEGKVPFSLEAGHKHNYISSSMGNYREGTREIVRDQPARILDLFKQQAKRSGAKLQVVQDKPNEVVAFYIHREVRYHLWASIVKGKGTMVYRSEDHPHKRHLDNPDDIELSEDFDKVFHIQNPSHHGTELLLFETMNDLKYAEEDVKSSFKTMGWELDQSFLEVTRKKANSPIFLFKQNKKECFVRLIEKPSGTHASIMLKSDFKE